MTLAFTGVTAATGVSRPALTPAPSGPYRVEGNRLLDAGGQPYLIRGTSLPAVPAEEFATGGSSPEFSPLSATVLITIRQRLNMNAVRLPVYPVEYEREPGYRARVENVVRLANRLELLVILEAAGAAKISTDELTRFWAHCSAGYRTNPNIFFALAGSQAETLVGIIRESGAVQPIVIADSAAAIADPNIVYQTSPGYAAVGTDRDRWGQFGSLAERVPVLVNGLDPELDRDSNECAAFPDDPTEATALVDDNLTYFDAHRISWTLSAFRPGKLISDYRILSGTKLDDGWTCGDPGDFSAGIGLILLSHLWNSPDTHRLFVVNGTRGGLALPRGGIVTAYGPILADRELQAGPPPLPLVLGNVSVRITDSRGTRRMAPLLYTGAGWGQISFIVPANVTPGPARAEVLRTDGSSVSASVIIDDVAPGLFTASADGRGPVIGQVTQEFSDGTKKTYPAWQCNPAGVCRTTPIVLSRRASTTVRLRGTGFRNTGLKPDIRVWIGDVPVPVLSSAQGTEPGIDQLTIRLPLDLRGIGETDLIFTVDGVLSNVVRINCGGA